MGGDERVQKLEQTARNAEIAKRFDHSLLTDAGVEQIGEFGFDPRFGAGLDPGGGDVEEGLAGPLERRDHILLVEAGPLIKIALFTLDEPRQLNRQHQLHADAWMLQKL